MYHGNVKHTGWKMQEWNYRKKTARLEMTDDVLWKAESIIFSSLVQCIYLFIISIILYLQQNCSETEP